MTQQTIAAEEPGHHRSLGSFVKSNIREYGMLLSLILIMAFFQFMTNGTLLRPLNLTNLVLQNSYIVIMALGMLLVIVAGHIDLSVGSIVGFVGGLAAMMMVRWGIDPVTTTIACLIVGGMIGAAQGYWVAYFKVPSFIVTLAGMLVFKGLTLALLGGMSVGPFPVVFQRLSSGFIPDVFGGEGFNYTALFLGAASVAVIIYFSFRSRANQLKHAVETAPLGLFAFKNALLAVLVIAFCYLLATY